MGLGDNFKYFYSIIGGYNHSTNSNLANDFFKAMGANVLPFSIALKHMDLFNHFIENTSFGPVSKLGKYSKVFLDMSSAPLSDLMGELGLRLNETLYDLNSKEAFVLGLKFGRVKTKKIDMLAFGRGIRSEVYSFMHGLIQSSGVGLFSKMNSADIERLHAGLDKSNDDFFLAIKPKAEEYARAMNGKTAALVFGCGERFQNGVYSLGNQLPNFLNNLDDKSILPILKSSSGLLNELCVKRLTHS